MKPSEPDRGNPAWLPLSLALFAFVQACFGIAVGAGWRPWEASSPSATEAPLSHGENGASLNNSSATAREADAVQASSAGSRSASQSAPILRHLLLSYRISDLTLTAGACKNAARSVLSADRFNNISEDRRIEAVYGTRGSIAVQVYCNKLETGRIDIVTGYSRNEQQIGSAYTNEFASDFDQAIRS